MEQIIKTFLDGSFLEYDKGCFDDWCVYLTQPSGKRKPPRDIDYFSAIKTYAAKYGIEKIYNDYVRIYEMTGKQVETDSLHRITEISSGYGHDALQIDIIFSILYMTMIAEEQKENTRLGKRIKRLGIYALLFENKTVSESANFMSGMGWKEIDNLCRQRGF